MLSLLEDLGEKVIGPVAAVGQPMHVLNELTEGDVRLTTGGEPTFSTLSILETQERIVMPNEEKFTGFIFKIQANMDPKHRDRIVTVDDPTTFTAAFTGEIPFRAMNELIYEYACHEGNYSMKNGLTGARISEQKALGKLGAAPSE